MAGENAAPSPDIPHWFLNLSETSESDGERRIQNMSVLVLEVESDSHHGMSLSSDVLMGLRIKAQ